MLQALAVGMMLALAMQAPAVPAPVAAEPVGEIVHPVWREIPRQSAIDRLYPYRAMANEKVGEATVRCVAKANGDLGDCKLVCELPPGWGFGQAALRYVQLFKLKPELPDGRSVEGGTVIMPAYFSPQGWQPQPTRCDKAG